MGLSKKFIEKENIPEEENDDERILRRTKEAENAYRDGDVKIGSFEDFWKDMND